jgi:hypothetical protein
MLGKTFRVAEGVSLEFRAEAFNVSNTPPLNDPSGASAQPCSAPSPATRAISSSRRRCISRAS